MVQPEETDFVVSLLDRLPGKTVVAVAEVEELGNLKMARKMYAELPHLAHERESLSETVIAIAGAVEVSGNVIGFAMLVEASANEICYLYTVLFDAVSVTSTDCSFDSVIVMMNIVSSSAGYHFCSDCGLCSCHDHSDLPLAAHRVVASSSARKIPETSHNSSHCGPRLQCLCLCTPSGPSHQCLPLCLRRLEACHRRYDRRGRGSL